MNAQQMKPPYKRSPCPAQERVGRNGLPDEYGARIKSGREDVIEGEDGIVRQKCGGGVRILRKRIGGSS